jgi:hypothetical protein
LRVVVEGVSLTGERDERWQLGMIFAGLREFEGGYLALGGGTSRGLGGARLDIERAELVDREGLLGYLEGDTPAVLEQEGLDHKRQDWQKAFVSELRRRAGDA